MPIMTRQIDPFCTAQLTGAEKFRSRSERRQCAQGCGDHRSRSV